MRRASFEMSVCVSYAVLRDSRSVGLPQVQFLVPCAAGKQTPIDSPVAPFLRFSIPPLLRSLASEIFRKIFSALKSHLWYNVRRQGERIVKEKGLQRGKGRKKHKGRIARGKIAKATK